jgi:RNA polymerase sigma-70 factor (ECF subfamily)
MEQRIPNSEFVADPDTALVEALKAQAPTAFDDLLKRYRRRLLTVAVRITKNREDAEDVVQESFLNVFKKIDSFRGDSRFSSWVTRIAVNQALMVVRSNKQKFVSIDDEMEVGSRAKRQEIIDSGYTPEELCAQLESAAAMLKLENVRKSSRRVVELRVRHELNELEIAQVLNLSLSNVKARLHRGRLDLRKAKLRRVGKDMSATNRKHAPRRSSESASTLASGNLLTARAALPSAKLQSSLPYHIAPQSLTQTSSLEVSGMETAL